MSNTLPLFYFVEGASHQEVMVELALGKRPHYPRGTGGYSMASKFMVRRYSGDALVRRVPSDDEIAAMQEEIDGVLALAWLKDGQRLSHFQDTDSYSYEYANIFVGGNNEAELLDKSKAVMEKLPFEFEPITERRHQMKYFESFPCQKGRARRDAGAKKISGNFSSQIVEDKVSRVFECA